MEDSIYIFSQLGNLWRIRPKDLEERKKSLNISKEDKLKIIGKVCEVLGGIND